MTSASKVCTISAQVGDKPFRLLDLPAEIWSKIGRLAIANHAALTSANIECVKHVKVSNGMASYGSTSTRSLMDRTAAKQPAITRTCRALRHELLAHYYRTRIAFHVQYDESEHSVDLSVVGEWLRSIGWVNRRHVSGVTISVEYDDLKAVRKLEKLLRKHEWKGMEFELVKVRGHIVDGDGYAWDKYKVVFS